MFPAASRSAPLPVKVDGFSVGAVMGFSEQHSIICLATEEEISNFKQVRSGARGASTCMDHAWSSEL